jgi:hypothetical protein
MCDFYSTFDTISSPPLGPQNHTKILFENHKNPEIARISQKDSWRTWTSLDFGKVLELVAERKKGRGKEEYSGGGCWDLRMNQNFPTGFQYSLQTWEIQWRMLEVP